MGIEGRWQAIARQATFGETPFRSIKRGRIADLILQPGGVGHTHRKSLFGIDEYDLTWEADPESGYVIRIPKPEIAIFATVVDGNLMGVWLSSMKSINGMCVLYERA